MSAPENLAPWYKTCRPIEPETAVDRYCETAVFRFAAPVTRGKLMQQVIEPTEISFDSYTMCSFLPNLDSSRAVPLVLIGYRKNQDPWFVWLVPKEGISASGLTDDPYYTKILHDPHTYFMKKLSKYIEETGSVKRGIEMLIDYHQNHLAFTQLTILGELPFRHRLEVELVAP